MFLHENVEKCGSICQLIKKQDVDSFFAFDLKRLFLDLIYIFLLMKPLGINMTFNFSFYAVGQGREEV
jgi:hypothetical protein